MTRKAAIGWRTTRRLSGERGVGCRFSVTAGMIGLLSRSVLSDCRARIQARRSGYRLLLAVYVDGPYAEGHDAGREVAHGAQAQDCPHGRRRRREARFLDRTTRISLRIIPEGVSSCRSPSSMPPSSTTSLTTG